MKINNLLATLLLYAVTQAATAVILPIKGDTHIINSATPLGNFTALNIDPTSKALLDFNLSALPNTLTSADIEKATLVYYVNKLTKAGQIQVMPVTSPWIEQTANRSTLVTTDIETLVASENITRLNTYNFLDVTGIVKRWIETPLQNYGLLIQPYNSTLTTIAIDSKEAGVTSHPAYIDIVLKTGVGEQGPKGETGPAGPQGPQGPQGLTGPAGTDGIQGPQGQAGPAGAQGIKGDTGETGPAGSLASYTHKLGDTGPGGGTIFFVDYFDTYPEFTYLESAPEYLPDNVWCNDTTSELLLGAYNSPNTALGMGQSNTQQMITSCTSGAAVDADNYISPNNTTDWYLPSQQELSLMIVTLKQLGLGSPVPLDKRFWSSNSYDVNRAGANYTVTPLGHSSTDNKTSSHGVWPVRKF